ncbi:hypothetical protein D3C74_50080 [compost metagenome]
MYEQEPKYISTDDLVQIIEDLGVEKKLQVIKYSGSDHIVVTCPEMIARIRDVTGTTL